MFLDVVPLHFYSPTFLLIALSFSSRVSCTFCCYAYKFSRSQLGFPFWNLMIFFILVQIRQSLSLGQNEYLIQAVSAYFLYCTRIDISQVYSPADVKFDLLVLFRCTVFSLLVFIFHTFYNQYNACVCSTEPVNICSYLYNPYLN